jgi:serine/threonine protein kinase
MNRYELSSQIGDGSFGRVMKATSKETGNVVRRFQFQFFGRRRRRRSNPRFT